MLRSRLFNQWTAYAGLVFGAAMLIPPLPGLGTVGVDAAFLSLLPLVVWEALVAWRLLELARISDDAAVHRRRQRQSAVSE